MKRIINLGIVLSVSFSLVSCGTWNSPNTQDQQRKAQAEKLKHDFFHPQANVAQREQAGLNKASPSEVDQQLENIKSMFAERNAYNREPIPSRLEGKSQGAGDCNMITLQSKAIPLNVLLTALAGNRTIRIQNDGGVIPMNTELNISVQNECDEDVIDNVLTNMDIAYTINNDVLTVMPTLTKSYQLPLIKPGQTYSSKSQSATAGGGGGGADGATASGSEGKMEFVDEGVDAFAEVKETLETLIGAKDKDSLNKVVVNKTEGTVIVQGRPSAQRKAEKFIAGFTDTMSKTIMITANIVEVNKSDLDERGISMDMLFNGVKSAASVLTDFGTQVQGSSGQVRIFNNGSSVLGDIQGILRAQGVQFEQRQAPSASVDNRTGATLRVGASEQFVKSIELGTSTSSTGASQSQPAPKLAWLKKGVQMEVWPHIMADKIVAQLHLSITDKKGDQTFTFNNVGTFNSPLLSDSEVNTKITIKSGQTAVIQGLTTESTNNTTNGFPVLSKIPFLGVLFGHEKNQTVKNEAVVFLTMTEVARN